MSNTKLTYGDGGIWTQQITTMTKQQQQEQRRAILDAAITPRTHKHMAVKMPIKLHAQLKAEAEEKGMKLGRYACDLILKGKESSYD